MNEKIEVANWPGWPARGSEQAETHVSYEYELSKLEAIADDLFKNRDAIAADIDAVARMQGVVLALRFLMKHIESIAGHVEPQRAA